MDNILHIDEMDNLSHFYEAGEAHKQYEESWNELRLIQELGIDPVTQAALNGKMLSEISEVFPFIKPIERITH